MGKLIFEKGENGLEVISYRVIGLKRVSNISKQFLELMLSYMCTKIPPLWIINNKIQLSLE